MTPDEAAQAAEALYLKIFTKASAAQAIELIAAALLEAAKPTRDPNAKIAGRTLEEWQSFARRDDCLDQMVPSDLRQLLGQIDHSEAP